MRRGLITLLVGGGLLGLVGAAGCNGDSFSCPPTGELGTLWTCSGTIFWNSSCQCEPREIPNKHFCAKSAFSAKNQFQAYYYKSYGAQTFTLTCVDTGKYFAAPQSEVPKLKPQGTSTCDAVEGDNTCLACAKVSCCAEYDACAGDLGCICWVGCKASGNADIVCAETANCGPLDAVSSAAAVCLNAACPGQCGVAGPGSGSCSCDSYGGTSSSSSGATPACTPGSFGSGEPCFSDGDCASCNCDATTQTCG